MSSLRNFRPVLGWSPILVGIGAGAIIFASTLLAGSMLYKQGKDAIHQELRGNLVRTATAAAGLIDGDLHKTFVSPEQRYTPEYQGAIAPLRRFQEANPDIAYIYTLILEDNELKFIIDPTPEGDADEDGVEDSTEIGEVYEESEEETWEMRVAINEQRTFADETFGADDWGVFISGYAPIFDSNGDFVSIVGIDLTADDYVARIADFERAGGLALGISALLSMLVGCLAFVYRRRALEAQIEKERSREELAKLAASLDEANQNLLHSSWRFEQLFNLLPVACFTFDTEGTIFEWSAECKSQFGLEAFEVVQKSMFDTIVDESSSKDFKQIIERVMAKDHVNEFEWTGINQAGDPFSYLLNVFPIKCNNDIVTGGIAACIDITERQMVQSLFEQKVTEVQEAYSELDESRIQLEFMNSALSDANAKLEEMATHDSLTGLANHGSIIDEIDRVISVSERHNRPFSIVMLDVDNFKKLNDTEGHVAGDEVLRSIAKTLRDSMRVNDIVGRYGGEEFVVVMPDTNEEQALLLTERLRNAVQTHVRPDKSITASFGVTTRTSSNQTATELIEIADGAMYEAKRDGKNKVLHSSQQTDAA